MSTYSSVWDALSDTPTEAETRRVRSSLMTALRDYVNSWDLREEESARRLGVTRPRLRELMAGALHKFSLEDLVGAAATAGLSMRVIVREG